MHCTASIEHTRKNGASRLRLPPQQRFLRQHIREQFCERAHKQVCRVGGPTLRTPLKPDLFLKEVLVRCMLRSITLLPALSE